MNSSRLRLAILWLPLAFAVRLYWVRHGAISYTSDTAILDLMARHLQHGQWTPYFWGQNYYGTLDSCVLAAMFALFGMKIFVSQMFPLIAWLIFLILCHRYILSTESILLADVSVFLLSLATPMLLGCTFSSYAYIVVPALGLAHWILAGRLWAGDRRPGICLAAGALAGFSWYYYASIALFWAAIALTFWATARGRRDLAWLRSRISEDSARKLWRRAVLLSGAGLPQPLRTSLVCVNILNLINLAFAMLLWYPGEWQARFAGITVKTFFYPTLKISVWAGAGVAWIVYRGAIRRKVVELWRSIPARKFIMGFSAGYAPAIAACLMGRMPGSPTKVVSGRTLLHNLHLTWGPIRADLIGHSRSHTLALLAALIYGAGVAALIVRFWTMTFKTASSSDRSMMPSFFPALALVSLVMALLGTSLVDVNGDRYLVPFALAALFGLSDVIVRTARHSYVAAVLLSALWSVHNVAATRYALPSGRSPSLYADLARDLSEAGVQGGYADYWLAYATTAASREQIIIMPTGSNDRYPPYAGRVRAMEHPVWIGADRPKGTAVTWGGTAYRIERYANVDGLPVAFLARLSS